MNDVDGFYLQCVRFCSSFPSLVRGRLEIGCANGWIRLGLGRFRLHSRLSILRVVGGGLGESILGVLASRLRVNLLIVSALLLINTRRLCNLYRGHKSGGVH